ncbi:type II toxin-antitoxin system PemK/MazF family toxin [Beggiatoa leptomitoformis]|uniref:mRNA interferase n=1 Tax=Beggiatoa leptomitoformis TaxID=288004 RepID=A0A2N9YG31_9GAMM|nr:type II toxin-antitoxin system PemK/MazF family toxin [Beggiatoa leptomitoformis]ALG68343.1 type II toxin-antitoxin system PemK/MazF family toxin [Beggiatoa leptomitoformis]AUI69339.1 type II toxin-antitoxin system PemK/MazF family toxin [Beggiatoa leptomitoformis]
MAVVNVKRFDIFLVNLDPTVGAEIQKTRPCLIISPDEMNQSISTVIIAPMTTVTRVGYPTRVDCSFNGKSGQIVLDQIRTVDKKRLVKQLGCIQKAEQQVVIDVLQSLFAL